MLGATALLATGWGGQSTPPEFRESFEVELVSGEVFVTPPEGERVMLEDRVMVPQGTVVDTRGGKVRLTVEIGVVGPVEQSNQLESSTWAQGVFRVVQLRSGVTECRLRGSLVEPAAVRRRRLWGEGKGRFRTKGRFGSATVRGTRWLTEDRPGGTLFLVRRGRVTVRDFARGETIVLKRGERYFARRPDRRSSGR